MKQRAKPGDIFCEQLPNGQYMFGRILMDIQEQCFKSKILKMKETRLRQYSSCYLVQVFDTISNSVLYNDLGKVLIPGITVDHNSFLNNDWRVIGNKAVSPEEVNFPESIWYYDGEVTLTVGELELVGKIKKRRFEDIDSGSLMDSMNLFQAALRLLGKKELVERYRHVPV